MCVSVRLYVCVRVRVCVYAGHVLMIVHAATCIARSCWVVSVGTIAPSWSTPPTRSHRTGTPQTHTHAHTHVVTIHTTPHHTTPHHITPHHTTPHHTTRHNTTRRTTPHNTTRHDTIQCHTTTPHTYRTHKCTHIPLPDTQSQQSHNVYIFT